MQIPLAQIQESLKHQTDLRNPWQVFSAAPHRLLFAAGMSQLGLALLWWGFELGGRYGGLWSPPATVMVSTWLHAFLMIYTVFPLFILGFLMTTYPRWMRQEAVPRSLYVPVFGLMLGGLALIYPGFWLHRYLLAAGMAVYLSGWGLGIYALLRVYAQHQGGDTRYETLFNFNLVAGWSGALLFLGGVVSEHWVLVYYATEVGLWLFLLPLLAGVCHRMLPYFSNAVLPNYRLWQPAWFLALLLVAGVGHVLLAANTLWAWRWLFDLPLMLGVFYLSYRWALRRSFADRLLAMLHVAFFWLGLALLLYNVQSLWLLIYGEIILPRAPLHALGLGFMLSLLVAMASRVTLGHSGRLLRADTLTWVCFWGVSALALTRVAAEIPGLAVLGGISSHLLSALLGLLVLIPWLGRYLPLLLQRRLDGKWE